MIVPYATPYYGVQLPHWKSDGGEYIMDCPLDRFCVRRRYHILLSKDIKGAPGWHVSFRNWCHDPNRRVPRKEWEGDVAALERKLGVKFKEIRTTPAGVTHFHQEI